MIFRYHFIDGSILDEVADGQARTPGESARVFAELLAQPDVRALSVTDRRTGRLNVIRVAAIKRIELVPEGGDGPDALRLPPHDPTGGPARIGYGPIERLM